MEVEGGAQCVWARVGSMMSKYYSYVGGTRYHLLVRERRSKKERKAKKKDACSGFRLNDDLRLRLNEVFHSNESIKSIESIENLGLTRYIRRVPIICCSEMGSWYRYSMASMVVDLLALPCFALSCYAMSRPESESLSLLVVGGGWLGQQRLQLLHY